MKTSRWLILATGTLALLFLGLIYAWSIFRTPFAALYPSWTSGQIAMTFTISMIAFCLGGWIGGLSGRHLSVRVRILIAAAMVACGFFGVSRLDPGHAASSLHALWFCYGVLAGGGVGLGYNAVVAAVLAWFGDIVGMASGILLTGFGLGGLVLGTVANALISSLGLLPAFMVLALACLIILVPAAFIIKAPQASASAAASGSDQADSRDLPPSKMVLTPAFWIFFIWAVLLNSAGLAVVGSAANISAAYGGAAVLGLIVSLFNGIGRIVAGSNYDRKGLAFATLCMVIFMLTAGLLLSLGHLTHSVILVVCGLIFTGLAYGAAPTLSSSFVNGTFGPKYYATNFSLINFTLIPAALIGPNVSTALQTAADGAYSTTFYAIVAASLAALALWAVLVRVLKK